MPARPGSHLDQPPDQASGRADTAVTDAERLVLGAVGAALEIGELDRACRGVAQAIDGQGLAALQLEPGLEREQYKQRRQIAGQQMVRGVEIFDQGGDRQPAPHPDEVERLERRMFVPDPSTLADHRLDSLGGAMQ